MKFAFAPKLLQTLRSGYDRSAFAGDVTAGLIVGLLAIPLAIGFGIASIPFTPPAGLPNPAAMGLYTAIVGGFIISAFGGSKVQIGGPTGAFVPIVAVIAERHGLAGLWLAMFMAGLMLIAMGLARTGGFSRFIPLPVVIGFTSGIAVVIALQQVKDLAGLKPEHPLPAEGWEKIQALGGLIGGFDPGTVLVSGLALAAIFLLPDRWRPRILVLLVGTMAVNLLSLTATPAHPGLATIGSAFGQPLGDRFGHAIPTGWPVFIPLEFSWSLAKAVLPSALVITFLAALESILSALATDKMIKDHHDSDTELIAQGLANVAMPWLGGLPVTGALARSSANVQSGSRTPVAGIVHALFLGGILLFAGPWIERIPLCILAVILLHVAARMFESRGFAEVRRVSKGELLVALVTFALTALIDLNWGVGFGLAVAAGSNILRLREITVLREVRHEEDPAAGLLVFRIDGVLFYAVADELVERVDRLFEAHPQARTLILRLGRMMSIDFQGMKALVDVHARCRERGVHLLLCEVQPHPARIMHHDGFFEELGLENVCGDFDEARQQARSEAAARLHAARLTASAP